MVRVVAKKVLWVYLCTSVLVYVLPKRCDEDSKSRGNRNRNDCAGEAQQVFATPYRAVYPQSLLVKGSVKIEAEVKLLLTASQSVRFGVERTVGLANGY
jgi:hypothetical protein